MQAFGLPYASNYISIHKNGKIFSYFFIKKIIKMKSLIPKKTQKVTINKV